MVIKKWSGGARLRSVIIMAVMTKPMNRAFVVAEDKSEEFKKVKKSSKLDEILKRVKALNIKSE